MRACVRGMRWDVPVGHVPRQAPENGGASAMPILTFVRIANACEPARVCALGELALAQGPCASHPPMPGARMWDRHRGMCMAAGCEWRISGTYVQTRTGTGRDVHQRMGYPHVE